jgi:hypothetical protein
MLLEPDGQTGQPNHKAQARARRALLGERPAGVSWSARHRKFRARVWCPRLGRRVSLGIHDSQYEAARAIRQYLSREG